jgi:hypothetical protein
VLPVVFYTGSRQCQSPGRLVDLVDLGEHFEGMIPAFEPLFINLPELETMPDAERLRWLQLLSYIMALVYHARAPSERPELQKTIESSVRTDIHRQEIFEMRSTIADELEEKGAPKNRRQVLLRQLKRRFGNVPAAVSATIRATHAPDQLDEWLDRFATAETLEKVGIGTPV